MRAKVRIAGVVAGQNERGFDVHGRGGRVRGAGVRGQRALFGQVQDTGFRVGVDVQRGGGQEEWRAGEHRERNTLGTGTREIERGERGRGGGGGRRERVWRRRPLLLRGPAHDTGLPIIL